MAGPCRAVAGGVARELGKGVPTGLARTLLFEKLRCEKQSTFIKFNDEDSTGIVEVKLWLENGNGLFMAERRAACRCTFLKPCLGNTPKQERDKARSGRLFEKLSTFVCVCF